MSGKVVVAVFLLLFIFLKPTMTTQKVAVVTGANKGIGFAIVRGLCKRFDGVVYLTSRDEERGRKAVAELNKERLTPEYHQLDVTNNKSIEAFRDHIQQKYGAIDILINNAGVMFSSSSTESAAQQAEQTLLVNYFAVASICDILSPIIRNGGRIINISSSLGHLSRIPSRTLRNTLKDPQLTIPRLSELANEYIEASRKGTQGADWGYSSYDVSKVLVTALTRIQQRLFNDRDIKVNAVHPGWVDTDLSGHTGPLTIDQGAVAPLFLALDAPDTVKGQYVWYNKNIVNWEGNEPSEL